MADQSTPTYHEVIVIGAGPCGIAAAGMAQARGLDVLVLEAGSCVASKWREHYDRLRLHSLRQFSGLPNHEIPKRAGRWVSRDDYAAYIDNYARSHSLQITFKTVVTRIEAKGSRWLLQTDSGQFEAGQVVVATGFNRTPVIPNWPGLDSFTGKFLHSSRYRSPKPFRDLHVLVIGSGNSGAEIAADLAEAGVEHVSISVRTSPNIIPREFPLGLTLSHLALILAHLPTSGIDRVSLVMQRWAFGDLSSFGLQFPLQGMRTRGLSGRTAMIDMGFVRQLKAGHIEVVPGVDAFEGAEVVCGNRRLRPDVVIAATGYKRDLESLVGHLGLLNEKGVPEVHAPDSTPKAPGIFFIGYKLHFTGLLWEMRRSAPKLAEVLIQNRLRATDASGLQLRTAKPVTF